MAVTNVYFELTDAFNAERLIAVLGSGQAVVHYRLAIMSKDGDWIVREDEDSCRRVLKTLADRGAWYRPGAPLDPRWLAGGWSSHLELRDERGRRVRCDFFSRPPRIPRKALDELFRSEQPPRSRPVVGLEELILMKQTQRAKDYPVIGELARRLPPERELALTTDPDRILELAADHGGSSDRPAVRAARRGDGRREVVRALAEEVDDLQQKDRERVRRFGSAAQRYLESFRRLSHEQLLLPGSHRRVCALAVEWLPPHPGGVA